MGAKPKISLTTGNLALLALVATFAFASGVISARPSSLTPLGAKQARDLIRNLAGFQLDPDQVRIKNINAGIGDSAIVEAELETDRQRRYADTPSGCRQQSRHARTPCTY